MAAGCQGEAEPQRTQTQADRDKVKAVAECVNMPLEVNGKMEKSNKVGLCGCIGAGLCGCVLVLGCVGVLVLGCVGVCWCWVGVCCVGVC